MDQVDFELEQRVLCLSFCISDKYYGTKSRLLIKLQSRKPKLIRFVRRVGWVKIGIELRKR